MEQQTVFPLDHFVELLSSRTQHKVKLAAFDMDGTLLGRDHQLSRRTVQVVQDISKAGITVLLATGRMNSAVRHHLEILRTPGIVVSHNGALVKDLHTQKVYHHQKVPQNLVFRILELIKPTNAFTHLNCDDDIYMTKHNPLSAQYAQDLGISLTYTTSLNELASQATSVLLMDTDKEVLQSILSKLQDEHSNEFDYVMIPGQGLDGVWQLQFLAPKTSKGEGVMQVAKHLGILPEEIISFGDSYNDIGMIKGTGIGIAMGNAVQDLKDIADFVTLPNYEDGVAQTLEVLLEWNK
jgi:Cof subfamily protein (haloacid dehalogenase superfamily)